MALQNRECVNLLLFLSAFAFTFIWAIPFCLLFYGLLAVEKINSLYLTGTDPFLMFLPSFLMGIADSYFTRQKSYELLFKKDYDKLLEMNYITNGQGSDKFMKGFSAVVFIGCIIFTILTVKSNIKFMKDGFINNTKFLSIKGYYYPYSHIKKAYYKPFRIKGL